MFTITKSYRNYPAAHRQPNHKGHCSQLHGHNWGWDITFSCNKVDDCGFVVDVGKLGAIKEYLTEMFDHTLLLNSEDPALPTLQSALAGLGILNTRSVPDCSMEGLAKLVYERVQALIFEGEIAGFDRGLVVIRVTCFEDDKNSATYEPE